jgi:hypothetical protein
MKQSKVFQLKELGGQMFQIFLSHTSGRSPRVTLLQYCRRTVLSVSLLCSSPAAILLELLTPFLLLIPLEMLRSNWFEGEQSKTRFNYRNKAPQIF